MSQLHLFTVVVLGAFAVVAVGCALVWAGRAVRRARRRRSDRADVVIDLTFFEEAVRRTESDGVRHRDDQLRTLSERRSTWPEGDGR